MTQFSSFDRQMMALALEEANKALYLSNPNPRVGCVITKGEQIVGQGLLNKLGPSMPRLKRLLMHDAWEQVTLILLPARFMSRLNLVRILVGHRRVVIRSSNFRQSAL